VKEKRIFDSPGIYTEEKFGNIYKTQTRHLKNDLIAIQQKYLQLPMTRVNVDNMWKDLMAHFKYFMLDDFKFNLIRDIKNEKIIIEPVGELSKLAIRGIMSLE